MKKSNILKLWRVKNGLSQREVAAKIGCSLGTYNEVETLKKPGTAKFWNAFQEAFELTGKDILILMSMYYEK